MTSTSFNIGLTTSKNSSRVIKPPGGGHSDIFGVNTNGNEVITPSKKRNVPPSTITSCFVHEEQKTRTQIMEKKINTEEWNGKIEEENNFVNNYKDENTESLKQGNKETDENKKPNDEEKIATVPKRQRVPPGGFSSALW